MPPGANPLFSRSRQYRAVQFQMLHYSSAKWREATYQLAALQPREVVSPTLTIRIEQRHAVAGLRIDSRDLDAFCPIAIPTRQTQIIEVVTAA
jgi:hypothetical protein